MASRVKSAGINSSYQNNLMLKYILHLLIVLAILLTPCVHATEFEGTASSVGFNAGMMASPPVDGQEHQGRMFQPGHHCWYEHTVFASFETAGHDIEIRRSPPLIADDDMLVSTVVAPLYEPPSA